MATEPTCPKCGDKLGPVMAVGGRDVAWWTERKITVHVAARHPDVEPTDLENRSQ